MRYEITMAAETTLASAFQLCPTVISSRTEKPRLSHIAGRAVPYRGWTAASFLGKKPVSARFWTMYAADATLAMLEPAGEMKAPNWSIVTTQCSIRILARSAKGELKFTPCQPPACASCSGGTAPRNAVCRAR